MDYEYQLETVRKEMAGEPAEVQIEYRLDLIVRELDEMCALASHAETVDLIARNRPAIGQIMVRVQLIASFLIARQPQLKVIRNG
jgi:hypothetical protein